MAFAAGTWWEVNSGGSDTANGGGFDTGNASFATDLVSTLSNTASPIVTSASYNFVTADEGHYLFTAAGTNLRKGWWLIVSTSGNAATLDASIGAGVLFNGQTDTNPTAGISNPAVSTSGGTWSIDYSRGTTPRISYTDMLVGATTTQFTSVLKPVGPNIVGNVIAVTSGATVQRVQVASVSGTTATCDKSLGTAAQVGVGGLGGALASPGMASGLMIANNRMALRNTGSPTVYTLSNSSNVSGGKVTLPGGSSGVTCMFGYATHRYLNNTDTRPQIKPSANSMVLINAASGSPTIARNLDARNPGANTGCTGFFVEGQGIIENCNADSLANGFLNDFGQNDFTLCSANACTAPFVCGGQGSVNYCVSTNSTSSTNGDFNISAINKLTHCAAIGGAGIGFNISAASTLENCIAYGMTGANGKGFVLPNSNTYTLLFNCYAEGNAHYGFTGTTNYSLNLRLFNCGGYNNGDANVNTSFFDSSNNLGFITLTSTAFTNAAGLDFSLNSDATGGALLIGTGFPSSYPGISTVIATDVGLGQSDTGTTGATAFAF